MDRQALTTTEDEDPLAQADTLKVVSCPICRAVYIPSSRQQEIVRGPEALLESAFLGVCHFCFRCQRPSCPQCWNPIHHACASCCEEARLPFRSPVASLEGLIFSSQASAQNPQAAPLSFTCLRNGTFYFPDSHPRAESLENDQVVSPSSYPITSGDLLAIQTRSGTPASTSSYPDWLREVMSPKQHAQNSQPLASTNRPWGNNPAPQQMLADPSGARPGQWGNNVAPWPVQSGPAAASPQASRPDWPAPAPVVLPMPALPLPAVAQQAEKNQEQDELEDEEHISLFEHIENILIIVISLLLLAIMLLIVLAVSSAPMDAFFFHLLHIDIRTEILYLLQLR